MYRYDEFDQTLINERAEQFRRQSARRLDGDINEDQFKPLRLMNGLYLQLHAYMLRVNVPYGCLSAHQLRRLAHIARRYDKGFGHFTTRQNIQFNWISLTDTPDIMTELAEVDMNTIQSSGNCVRNITADHYAGRARDEIEDPRVWCELLRQYSVLHPEFSYLPRKFKLALTGSPHDRAAVAVHDIGLRLHHDNQGRPGFEVIVGGGQGRTPVIGKTIRQWIEPRHVISYVEAILRVYNLYGRRDNIFKARIKILVNAIGIDKFRKLVDTEWEQIRDTGLQVSNTEFERINAHFLPPDYENLADQGDELAAKRTREPAFDAWMRSNVTGHKVPGYAIVNISLKAPGRIPGDISADKMEHVAALADQFSFGELRVNHRQNLTFVDVRQIDLYLLWEQLVALELATANIGLASDIIACPGLDYCALANARSIPIAQDISLHFANSGKLQQVGNLTINISGCMNACGHHHVGNIGILGVNKRGKEYFQLTLGGSADEHASLGIRLGRGLPRAEVPGAIERIVDTYLTIRQATETFLQTYRRIGIEPFREAVYGPVNVSRRVA
ncbi:MAG: nitrite/sulfite reductase [Gammaproteobacteria bacterium]|jgi:sulfite reductase (NADPH) hemoprotein beta-component|nr:sulfite reductase [Chromatiales bacterium]MDP6674224.1 nitrite/sulfite reductase [Gammaproteobacteria bacterium]